MEPQASLRPVRKVRAGALFGAIATIVVAALTTWKPSLKTTLLTPEVTAAAMLVITFLASYIAKPAKDETVLEDRSGAMRSALKPA